MGANLKYVQSLDERNIIQTIGCKAANLASVKQAGFNIPASLCLSSLDVTQSSMAILIQKMVPSDFAGVAFSRDPNTEHSNKLIIEVVPGECANLVDGSISPDQFQLDRENLKIIMRDSIQANQSLLSDLAQTHVTSIAKNMLKLEVFFKKPIDVEWSMHKNKLTILQARPISCAVDMNKKRLWYLSLTPNRKNLNQLAEEVKHTLIPKLTALGLAMQKENLTYLNDFLLADAIEGRFKSLKYWRQIYKEKFIPFAHGVREFGQYYNDLLKPADPYQFIQLLQSQDRIARQRSKALLNCSQYLTAAPELVNFLENWLKKNETLIQENDYGIIQSKKSGSLFIKTYTALKAEYFDITLNEQRWYDRDDLIVKLLLNYVEKVKKPVNTMDAKALLEAYYHVAPDRAYAQHVLELGRLSWILRDNDNLLLARLESQCLKALAMAQQRLVQIKRLSASALIREADYPNLVVALRDQLKDRQYLTVDGTLGLVILN